MLTESDTRRFYAKVALPCPDTGCMLWLASTQLSGYGRLSVGPAKARKLLGAHRVALYLATGEWGVEAMHSCDNPRCCNPEHLSWGTKALNMWDMVQKGRHHQQQKTHCPQGHPLSGDNLRGSKRSGRQCRACHNAGSRRH